MAENGIFRSPLSAALHLALIKSIGFDLQQVMHTMGNVAPVF
jgi:hypothetical protein